MFGFRHLPARPFGPFVPALVQSCPHRISALPWASSMIM